MIKVSIVVPVFNIEKKLLKKCIDSLLHQTLKEIEIILVDDASTKQETKDILNDYEQKYKENIILITHKLNKKQGGARNSGLKASKGVFIGFVDADDYVDKDIYRLLYEKAIEENSDIVDSDYIEIDSNNTILNYKISIEDMELNKMILSSGRVWTKLYKRNMLIKNNVFFPEHMFYEDNAISGLHLLYAKKVSKINKYLYYYVRHKNSTISNASLHIDDKIKAGKIFYTTMKERGFLDKYPEPLLIKYFEVYFKSTYRLIMKYDINYYNTLNSIIKDMQNNGVDIQSVQIQKKLKNKQKFEIWLLLNTPKLFQFYVDFKYKKYKENNE